MGTVVETTIADVEQDVGTGWFKVVTENPESSYSTKRPDLAQIAKGLKGHKVLLDYDEQVVNKPAADGSGMRTYRNRYFNGAAPVNEPQASTDGFTQTDSFARRPTPPEDAWRMALSTG